MSPRREPHNTAARQSAILVRARKKSAFAASSSGGRGGFNADGRGGAALGARGMFKLLFRDSRAWVRLDQLEHYRLLDGIGCDTWRCGYVAASAMADHLRDEVRNSARRGAVCQENTD